MKITQYQFKISKIVSLAGLSLVILIGATGCASNKQVTTETIKDSITPILTQGAQTTPTPTPIPLTPAPGVSEIPEEEKKEEPEEKLLTPEAALKKVQEKVDQSVYRVEMEEDLISIEDRMFYEFHVYENEKEIQPLILVDQGNGVLYYYDSDHVLSAFTKFPADSVTTETVEGAITTDDALELLKTLSKEKLGLKKDLKDYNIDADEWTTMVNGNSCYCFNVYENEDRLAGVYYINVNGDEIYIFDDKIGDFKKIK